MQFLSRLGIGRSDADRNTASTLAAVAPNAVAILLVVLLAAQLASFVWHLITPIGVDAGAVAIQPAPRAADKGPDVTGIVNAHLFGSAALPASGEAAGAPATNLRLVLAGTLAGSDPAAGWAIIGETAQTAKVYATGATVPGGARLKEVYADRVILEHGGRLESLLLPRLTNSAGPTPVSYPARARATQRRNLADTVRTLAQRDPGAIGEIIRPQPVFAGGQLRGYRVYPGRNRAQFANLGLMPGDLVTAVNGVPLDDPNRGLETLRGIGEGGAVNLTVERNGADQQVTVDPSAIEQAAVPAGSPQQSDDEE